MVPFRKSLTFTLALILILNGCVSPKETKKDYSAETTITYTNLNTESEQAELKSLLENAGVSKSQTDDLFKEINHFNDSVPDNMLSSGWETSPITYTKYDPYEMQEIYSEKNPDFIGYNCRITAFSIIKDFVKADADIESDVLLLDLESLRENPSAAASQEDLDKFKSLFGEIPTAASKNTDEHLEAMEKEWAIRSINFDENKNMHLITVIFHDSADENKNILFVGHAGILFESEKALYFFEKVAFQEPYRLISFNNRTELSDYLMIKYDISENQPTADPFITEDGKLMAGYRKNPMK